ncbi:MAG TPA: DUF4810 domain-containing protein [Paraburkholderia sp.]|jgi:hypothetical protein|nr:DUF4810 domain-containing protein [Paraburkholderia sp.]
MHRRIGRPRGAAALAVLAALGLLALGGCASGTAQLYQWDGYQPQVYASLQGRKSAVEQIGALEEAQQTIRAKGGTLPPGFRAHLGALYASIGKRDEALAQLAAEKAAFPEATTYMDFLSTNLKR